MSLRSYPLRRLPVALCGALGVLSLALMACGTTDYTANKAARETPRGSRLPQTALPMPPVATAHESSSSTSAPSGVAVVHASTWTTLDGRRAKGADFAGKVLVLDFWATYCPPCRDEVPHLIALQRRYGAQGLHVVGLNVGGAEDRPKVPDFIEEFGIQYALGYPDDHMSELFFAETSAIPQTYVYDRKGRLAKRFVGFDANISAELERVVQAALEEKE